MYETSSGDVNFDEPSGPLGGDQGWEVDFGDTSKPWQDMSPEQKKMAGAGCGILVLVVVIVTLSGGSSDDGSSAGPTNSLSPALQTSGGGDSTSAAWYSPACVASCLAVSAADDASFDGSCGLRTHAIRLDGSNWLQMDNHADFQPSDEQGHQSFTIEQWIQPTDIQTHSVTFQDYGKSYTDNISVKFLASDDPNHPGKVWCSARDHWHQSLSVYSKTSVEVGTWMHIACVFQRNDAEGDGEDEVMTLYINGVQEDTASGPLSEVETGGGPPVTLGCQTFGAEYGLFFSGLIAGFRYWDSERTSAEIQGSMFSALVSEIVDDPHLLVASNFASHISNEQTGEQHVMKLMQYSPGNCGLTVSPFSSVTAEQVEITRRGVCFSCGTSSCGVDRADTRHSAVADAEPGSSSDSPAADCSEVPHSGQHWLSSSSWIANDPQRWLLSSSFAHANGPEVNILTDDSSAWNGHISTEPNWLSLDLGESYTISGIRLRGHLAGEMFRDSALQYSADGVDWTDLFQFQGSREGCNSEQVQDCQGACSHNCQGDLQEFSTSHERSARYWRVYVFDTYGGAGDEETQGAYIYYMQLYGYKDSLGPSSYLAYCDMDTAGGGWELVTKWSNVEDTGHSLQSMLELGFNGQHASSGALPYPFARNLLSFGTQATTCGLADSDAMYPGFARWQHQKNVEIRVDYELFEKNDKPETAQDETNARKDSNYMKWVLKGDVTPDDVFAPVRTGETGCHEFVGEKSSVDLYVHDPEAALQAQDDGGGYSEYFLGNSQSRYAGDQGGAQGAIVEGGNYAGQGIFGVQGDIAGTRPAGVNWANSCGAGHSLSICNLEHAPSFSRNPDFDYDSAMPHVGTAPWLNTMMHTFYNSQSTSRNSDRCTWFCWHDNREGSESGNYWEGRSFWMKRHKAGSTLGTWSQWHHSSECSLGARGQDELGAIYLDGTNWISIEDHEDMQPSDKNGDKPYTVEQWIKVEEFVDGRSEFDPNGDYMLVFQNYGADRNNVAWINILGDSNEIHPHKVTCGVRDENHVSLNIHSSTSVKRDEWIHIACVFKRDDIDITPGAEDGYEDEELMMYVDGTLEDYNHAALEGINTGGGAPILLGAHGWISDTDANDGSRRESFSNRLKGRIAQFKYWDVPLSQYEIQVGQFSMPNTLDTHLVAYAAFAGSNPLRTAEDTGTQHDMQLMTHGRDGSVVEDTTACGDVCAAVRTVIIRGDCSAGSTNVQSSLACPQRLSAYPAGRVEVFSPRAGWGTVCGHGYWQDDGAANVVCRALGYTSGSLYTYGLSRVTDSLMPIVAGWRTCEGTEASIFDCMEEGTPTDRECRYGCDSSCTHSLDQGATCFDSDTHHGQIRPQVRVCSGMDRYATLGPASQDVQQEVRFGCIEYQTARCQFSTLAADNGGTAASLLTATRAFASCAETGEEEGFCHGLLASASHLSNQDVCAPPPGCDGRVTAWLQDGSCFTAVGEGTDNVCNNNGLGTCDGLFGAEPPNGCACAIRDVAFHIRVPVSTRLQ
jgi:hypothetical protein